MPDNGADWPAGPVGSDDAFLFSFSSEILAGSPENARM